MIGKIRIRRLVIAGIIFIALLIYLFTTPFNATKVQFVKESFLHRNLNKLTDKITNWLEGQVLGISYEERFCKHITKWTRESKYPPVSVVAKQLNIEDGDSVFINGLHCGEWLVALKGTFPNIKLFGVDKDSESIGYVQKLVNGTYKVSQPFELDKTGFTEKFDHAIIDGILSIYSPELQCKTLVQMIPTLKAGGSLYIGKNFEQCEDNKVVEKHLKKYVHVQVLPKCYWSQVCLVKRPDIVEILYSKENHIMKNNVEEKIEGQSKDDANEIKKKKEELLVDFSLCATSIFIHKHITFHSKDRQNMLPDSKYIHDLHLHQCTSSETANSTNINRLKYDKESIKKAVINMKIKGLDVP